MILFKMAGFFVVLKSFWNMWVPVRAYLYLMRSKKHAPAVDLLLFVEWFFLLLMLVVSFIFRQKEFFVCLLICLACVALSYFVLHVMAVVVSRFAKKYDIQ
ncbi:hypothetical protein CK620_10360 [Vandammella animalimorsus]|uniref:Uncharacterized protein n=1 Tax=Vandammella animalimorsus TaxID=2029117 RepID=A0A2A2A8Z5_9BURK|nr:hypothetical protein CK620_10360 [Vandammella animalimorsus]